MTPTDTAKLADMMEEIIESRMATIYDDELRAAAAALRELEAAHAREAKLREALEPFVQWHRIRESHGGLTGQPHHPDDTPIFMAASDRGEQMITLGDLRRARAAHGGAG